MLILYFLFSHQPGYKYLLQLDDDSLLGTKLNFDLVQDLRRRNIYMATDLVREEGDDICHGLPELTAYWLAISKYQVEGTLFKHCDPPSIQGLTTKGWDRMNIQGNWVFISLDFWFRDIVQDFVVTVLRSGKPSFFFIMS